MNAPESWSRRGFCKALAAASLTSYAASPMKTEAQTDSRAASENQSAGDLPPPQNLASKGEVPRRKFGKTDVVVSAMALGGFTFATAKTKAEAINIVHEAIDNGITFMDNAWDYHDGKSEELMGEALEGRRDKVFLMTKCCSHGRD